MTSPYADLPPKAYWRTGVAERDPLDPGDLYTPGIRVAQSDRIVTAGSCFAQHVGRTLRQAGFNVQDAEPLPDWIPDAEANRFGYRLFSGRYGNIYTVRQLAQLIDEVQGKAAPALPVWPMGETFVDAQRPNVEPDGLPDEETVHAHRRAHLEALAGLFSNMDVFVFTFGLTEAWRHRETGTVYPTAPGTLAGTHDPEVYEFVNYGFNEIAKDFGAVRKTLMELNPGLRFLITVSPVPLTATATGKHVEVATCYSKSVLRAVCGTLADRFRNVDYFPSYEIITSQTARGAYYGPNLRSVTRTGVGQAMGLFMRAHGITPGEAPAPGPAAPAEDDVVCEEALLEAFAQ